MISIQPSHVAVLVPSVRKAANYLKQFDFQISKEEVWEGEGTKEIYIERDKSNSLLLMEPVLPGAYMRSLQKRGPGLHHLAIDVLNLESYIETLAGSGWLLHPMSFKTMKQTQTVYLARPGFPGLIEVQERQDIPVLPLFVKGVALPMEPSLSHLVKHVGLSEIVSVSSDKIILSLDKKTIFLDQLL